MIWRKLLLAFLVAAQIVAPASAQSPAVRAAILGAKAPVFLQPYNYDLAFFGDSRTAYGGQRSGATGTSAVFDTPNTRGLDGWLPMLSGNRLRAGASRQFGVGGSGPSPSSTLPFYSNPRANGGGGSTDPNTGLLQIAASPSAIVVFWGGVNNMATSGSSTQLSATGDARAATAAVFKALTDPTFSINLYRKSDGVLTHSGPLPLYNGLPKTIIVLSEVPNGIKDDGTTFASYLITDAAAAAEWKGWSTWLKSFSYDSGSPNANPRIVAVETLTSPLLLSANPSDAALWRNLQGILEDGVHQMPTGARRISQIVANRIVPLLKSPDYNEPVTTANASSRTFIPNQLFADPGSLGSITNCSALITRTDGTNGAVFTGTIAGSVLTVTSVEAGTIAVNQTLTNTAAATEPRISSLGTGSGGVGTYNLNSSPGDVSTPTTFNTALVPASTTINGGGSGMQISFSVSPEPDGNGNAMTLTFSGTAASSGTVTIRQSINASVVNAMIAAADGDTVSLLRASAKVSLDVSSGPQPLSAVNLFPSITMSNGNYTQQVSSQAAASGDYSLRTSLDNSYSDLWHLTPVIDLRPAKAAGVTMSSGTIGLQVKYAAGTMNFTVKLSRMSLYKSTYPEYLN